MAAVFEFARDGLDGEFVAGLVKQNEAALRGLLADGRLAVQAREHLVKAGADLLEGQVNGLFAGGRFFALDDGGKQAHAVSVALADGGMQRVGNGLLSTCAFHAPPAAIALVHWIAVQFHRVRLIGAETRGDVIEVLLDPVGLPLWHADACQHEPGQARVVARFVQVQQIHAGVGYESGPLHGGPQKKKGQAG